MKTIMRFRQRTALVLGAFLLFAEATAGPGHDHGEATAVGAYEGPKRLPDGSVFLPKQAQRQLAVRTQRTAEEALAPAFELSGRVLMDPNAGGKVQSTQTGRLESGPNGLPSLGQSVKAGDVLGYVAPTITMLERAGQEASVAELKAGLDLARKRLARLQELEGTVPRKDIEAAASEVSSLTARLQTTSVALTTREPLKAPLAGIISSTHVVAGQVVEANQTLFEIVAPERLVIEALSYDLSLAGDVGESWLLGDKHPAAPLQFIGAGAQLKEQALPLLFRVQKGTPAALAVGQSARVLVQSREQLRAVPILRAAIVKNPANQDIVWVHDHAEQFVPRLVQFTPLDGSRVALTAGLKAGERVVVQGASLINQVR